MHLMNVLIPQVSETYSLSFNFREHRLLGFHLFNQNLIKIFNLEISKITK